MSQRLAFYIIFLFSGLILFSCSPRVSKPVSSAAPVVYPGPPDTARIQFLTRISASGDIKVKRQGLKRFLLGEDKSSPILKPYGLAMHEGEIYICDVGLNGLEIIDLEQHKFRIFMPSGRGALRLPLNCAVDSTGNMYIVDTERRQLLVYTPDGQFVDAVGGDTTSRPTDVALAKDKIWLVEAKSHKIHVYGMKDRKKLFEFPDAQLGDPGYLFTPYNIVVSDSLVYVTDFGDSRVKVYSHKGEFIRSIGSYGKGIGQFVRPKGIAVDRDGIVYVPDAAFENVQMFNSEGQLLMFFGGPYQGPGDMYLPAKVFIDYDNLKYFQKYVDPAYKLKYIILVSNQFGPDKINIYGALERKK